MSLATELRRQAWAPPPELHPDEWCEQHITDVPGSPLGGGFNAGYVPVIRDVMRAIADPENSLVVLCQCVQSTKTFSIEASIVHQVATDTFPTGFFLPKDSEARDEMTHRLRPLLERCAATKPLIPTGRNRDLATKSSILFNNGKSLWLRGAAISNLQRLSLRRVYADECWLYDAGVIGEMEARITAFDLGQLILASQGSAKGHDFHKKWLETDQGVLAFRCPDCGASQTYGLACVAFDTVRGDDERYDYAAIRPTARYRCTACEGEFPDNQKTRARLMKTWHFVRQNPSAPKGRVGFRIPATAIKPLDSLVEEYLRGKEENYFDQLTERSKTFWLKRMADFWDESAAEDDDFVVTEETSGYTLETAIPWEDEAHWIVGRDGKPVIVSEDYEGKSFPLRIAAVDVQRDHYYLLARSYSATGESRLIHVSKPLSFEEIRQRTEQLGLHPACVFVDAGYDTANVYNACSEYGFRPVKGTQRETFTHKLKDGRRVERFFFVRKPIPLNNNRSVRVCNLAVNPIKDQLARRLRRGISTIPSDVPDWYRKQVSSEKRIVKPNGDRYWRGRSQRAGRDNHCWDCEVYLQGGALMMRVGDPEES